jgi:hypothetical protein
LTEKDIKTKAADVNKISLDYHLTHAVFACDRLLADDFKKIGEVKTKNLNKELQDACRKNDVVAIEEVMKKTKALSVKKYRIFVDYIDMSPESGRVVKADSKLIISLPQKLATDAKVEKGKVNSAGIKKLRQVMAHELGHIVLHTEALINTDSLNGSSDLKGDEENEADIFATELLRLRHERNELLKTAV